MHASRMASAPVICGVDGSDESRRAFHEAVRLSTALDAPLEAVMAWQHAPAAYGLPYPQPERSPKVLAFAALEEVVTDEFGGAWPDWVRLRAEAGHPGKVLVDLSKDAGMLVVGCRGLSGLGSPFLGSVSLYCATQAACPVLVVRR